LKTVDVAQRVGKHSQQASSGTEVRSLRGGVRSRGEAGAQAVTLNPEIIARWWSERIFRESGESRHIG